MTQHNAALVEETNVPIEQTETQATDLDRIVETFVLPGSEMRRERAPAPSRAPKATGIKAASSRYRAWQFRLAVEPGWDEF